MRIPPSRSLVDEPTPKLLHDRFTLERVDMIKFVPALFGALLEFYFKHPICINAEQFLVSRSFLRFL